MQHDLCLGLEYFNNLESCTQNVIVSAGTIKSSCLSGVFVIKLLIVVQIHKTSKICMLFCNELIQ